MENLYLRPAKSSDCQLLWQWANDEAVRKNSFQTNDIPLAEHEKWFANVLAAPDILLYILMVEEAPAGQIRLNKLDGWLISYSIAPAYRGQGYGRIMLQLAENELIGAGHAKEKLLAEVKAGNIASRRIFSGLGYQKTSGRHDNAYTYVKNVQSNMYEVDMLKSTPGGQQSSC